MNQAEVEAWIVAQGGPSAVQYNRSTKAVDNPASDPLTAQAAGVKFDPTAPEKISVSEESWTNSKTGATLRVSRRSDNDFDVIENKTADPNKPASTGTTTKPTNVYVGTNPQTGKPTQVSEYPDPSAPGGVRREYDDTQVPTAAAGEAKPPEQKDEGGTRYVWQANPGGPNAGGKWVPVGSAPETPAERQAREATAPTQSVATKEVGGKVYTVVTIIPKPGQPGQPGQVVLGPDGKPAPGGIPGEPPKDTPTTVTRDGKTYIQHNVQKPDGSSEIYFTDQSGARTTLPDEASSLPKGVPAWTPDPSKPAYGLVERRNQLIALADAGTIPRESVAKILESDRAIAETTASQTVRQQAEERATRQQNEVERAGRAGMVNTAWQQAQQEPPGQAAYAGWNAPYRFAGQMALQNVYGGMGAWGQAAQATAPVPAPAPTPAPTPPNALGLGAIGNQTAPAGAPPPALPMTPERAAGIMANPVFRPAPVTAPVSSPPPTAARPTAPQPGPLTPVAPSPSGPPVRDDWNQPGPPVNMDPSLRPVGMAPPGAWGDAAYGASASYDDTARNLIAEGFDPAVVERVRRRRMAMMGVA